MAHGHHHHRSSHFLPRDSVDARSNIADVDIRAPVPIPLPLPDPNAAPDPKGPPNVETAVSVVIVTMANTYTGDVVWLTMGPDDTPSSHQAQPTSAPAPVTSDAASNQPSSKTKPPKSTSVAHSTSSSDDTSEILPTGTSSVSATKLNVASATTANAAAAASTTAAVASASSGGMSGGAKAGLALGILLAIGAILALVLFAYKKKREQSNGHKRMSDDEKGMMAMTEPSHNPPPAAAPAVVPVVETAPSIRSAKTASTAPRLSLRPVTQFSPMWAGEDSANNRQSINSNSTLGIAAAGAIGAQQNASRDNLAPSQPQQQPVSAWERTGAQNNANDPSNPFGNHAETVVEPSNQNNAAEKSVASSINHTPGNSIGASTTAEIGVAEAAAVGGAAGAAAIAALPKPVTVKAGPVEAPLPSPAWTEDLPASPGPAPVGALPVVGAASQGGSPPPAPNNVHRVQMDFSPSMEDELEIHAGQLVRMLHEYDDGWALCIRMDRSRQGVCPRSCLSKHPVKPRVGPPRGPPARPRATGPAGPLGPPAPIAGNLQPRPLTPTGRNSPNAFVQQPRPLSPASGRNSPGLYGPPPRPMSPAGGRPRAQSNAVPRSQSPGPYGGSNLKPMPPSDAQGRRRSNSASQIQARRNSPPGPSKMNPAAFPAVVPQRKPVPGQAM
jgi:hypothetical protein